MHIYATPNHQRTAFHIDSDYQKARLLDWLKKYDGFKIEPVREDSYQRRGYLFGAVIPCYVEWQYGIDAREPGRQEARELLFKRDFNSEIIENRDGDPERIPLSFKGRMADVLDTYTRWAEENGAPVPNPELYKLYRDRWSMDARFPTFYDWLAFLEIDNDSMPSAETLARLGD